MRYRVRTTAAYCKQLRLLLNVINNPRSGTYQLIKAQGKIEALNKETAIAKQVDDLLDELSNAQKEFLQVVIPAQLTEITEEKETIRPEDYWAGLE